MHQGERLRVLFKELKLTQDEIASKLGMTRQNLNYHLRKEELDGNFVRLLKEKIGFTSLTNGFSKTVQTNVIEEAAPPKYQRQNAAYINLGDQVVLMYVPLVNQYAYAGYLSGYADAEFIESLPKVPFLVDKEYRGSYCAFEIRGDSMRDGSEDGYKEGDKVLGREIDQALWRDKLHIKKWDFIIVHKTEGILLKKIIAHDVEKGLLTLHSLNDMYPDFIIKIKDVAQIFNVVKVERKK